MIALPNIFSGENKVFHDDRRLGLCCEHASNSCKVEIDQQADKEHLDLKVKTKTSPFRKSIETRNQVSIH